jgi:hypothetical protein
MRDPRTSERGASRGVKENAQRAEATSRLKYRKSRPNVHGSWGARRPGPECPAARRASGSEDDSGPWSSKAGPRDPRTLQGATYTPLSVGSPYHAPSVLPPYRYDYRNLRVQSIEDGKTVPYEYDQTGDRLYRENGSIDGLVRWSPIFST